MELLIDREALAEAAGEGLYLPVRYPVRAESRVAGYLAARDVPAPEENLVENEADRKPHTLVAHDLVKSYKRRTVVRNVTIHVDKGEVVSWLIDKGATDAMAIRLREVGSRNDGRGERKLL